MLSTASSVRKDFTRIAGNAWPFDFTIVDSDGLPKDLTGATEIVWVLVNLPGPGAGRIEYIRKTLSGGITNTGAGGVVQVRPLAADTVGLVAGRYYYELRINIGGSEPGPITTNDGVITVLASCVQP